MRKIVGYSSNIYTTLAVVDTIILSSKFSSGLKIHTSPRLN